MPARIEYSVGIRADEGTSLAEAATLMNKIPEYEAEHHEMFAYLLLVAVRKEWEAAERCRARREKQERRKKK